MSQQFTIKVTTSPRERHGKARVYVWNAPEPKIELPAPTVRGVDLEVDKAYDRYNRSLVRIMKSWAVEAQEQGLIPEGTLKFSNKAGCSCLCSPGFILSDTWSDVDYHVTLTEATPVEEENSPEAEAAYAELMERKVAEQKAKRELAEKVRNAVSLSY
jgi:hypothetical protein